MPPCPRCAGAAIKKDGKVGATQRYRCHTCRRTFIARMGTPFAGHRWPREVIVTAVRWYLRFRLSAADGHCQLKSGRGAGAYFEAWCSGADIGGQAMAGVPTTTRQVAKRSWRVAR